MESSDYMIDDISFNYMDNLGNIKKYIIVDKITINNKNFLIYQEENKEDLYASFYETINNKIKLIPIECDEYYDIIDKYLESL